jgi:cell division protein FtsL
VSLIDTSAATDRPAPSPAPERRRGPHLAPVRRPTRRRSPAVPVLVGTGIVIVALFALAAMHALLIGGQVELDHMQREVAAESEEVRRLQLRVAELESPHRVLAVARERLGMVQPEEIGYLLPAGVDTGDDALVTVAPAVVPPEPEPLADVETSTESDSGTAEAGAETDVDADASSAPTEPGPAPLAEEDAE